jgi:hypothetical protein
MLKKEDTAARRPLSIPECQRGAGAILDVMHTTGELRCQDRVTGGARPPRGLLLGLLSVERGPDSC